MYFSPSASWRKPLDLSADEALALKPCRSMTSGSGVLPSYAEGAYWMYERSPPDDWIESMLRPLRSVPPLQPSDGKGASAVSIGGSRGADIAPLPPLPMDPAAIGCTWITLAPPLAPATGAPAALP